MDTSAEFLKTISESIIYILGNNPKDLEHNIVV